MTLTRSFRETIRERAQRDATFRRAMLREAVSLLLSGEVGPGRSLLRDYINATIGFSGLAGATNISEKSLMRMFGPKGNPTAENLFGVIAELQSFEGVNLVVSNRRVEGKKRKAG